MKAQYSEEIKAQVVAKLLEGQNAAFLAKEFDIPEGTIKSWKSRLTDASVFRKVATEKKTDIGDLVIKLLEAQLLTQIAIAETTRDVSWIKRQDASGLAVYAGVEKDKIYRLLEMLSRDNAANDNTSED